MLRHFADEAVPIVGRSEINHTDYELEGRNREREDSDNEIMRSSDYTANGAIGDKVEKFEEIPAYDKHEIVEGDCYEELGFCFPSRKKWYIVTIIFWVQVCMNFNTTIYFNAIGGTSKTDQAANYSAGLFLLTYAFGCELWAPWSEEFGRWPILQLSMWLVNIWQIPVALAPNLTTMMVGRALGGLSTAGSSVTLGMIADMWEADTQQYAVAYVVFGSVFGTMLGPIVGGFFESYRDGRSVSAVCNTYPTPY
jgi:hypothetical protein